MEDLLAKWNMVETAHEMEDSEKEAFKLIRGKPNYVWSGRVIEFVLAYSGFDPFASIEAYRNRTSGWKLRLTKRWRRLPMLISIYLPIKTLTIFFVRSTIGEVDKEQDGQLMRTLNQLLSFLGDPYSTPPLPGLVMYVEFPLTLFWVRFCMPIYMEKVEHYDCSIARFILEPEEEIRQFDLQASQMLKDTCETIERQRWISSRNFRFEQRSREDLKLFSAKQNQIHRQLSMMREVRRQIHLVRPKALRPEWHQLNRTFAPILCVLGTGSIICMSALIAIHFDSIAWQGRCVRQRFLRTGKYSEDNSDCHLLEVFNYSDLLVMLEIELYFALIGQIPAGGILAFLILQTTHQLYHTNNVVRDLRELLADLRRWDASQPVADDGGSICDHLSRSLCINIVRIRMFERESRKSVTALSHGTRLSILFCLSYTAIVFATAKMKTSLDKVTASQIASVTLDTHGSMVVLLVTWLIMTLQLSAIQIASASIPSQIAYLDKLVCSLVAELIRIQQTGRTANDLERLKEHDCCFPMDDPITHLWRRQMLSRRSSDDRAAVCVFGTKFTYERVLAMQFYYATIISLLHSFIK